MILEPGSGLFIPKQLSLGIQLLLVAQHQLVHLTPLMGCGCVCCKSSGVNSTFIPKFWLPQLQIGLTLALVHIYHIGCRDNISLVCLGSKMLICYHIIWVRPYDCYNSSHLLVTPVQLMRPETRAIYQCHSHMQACLYRYRLEQRISVHLKVNSYLKTEGCLLTIHDHS